MAKTVVIWDSGDFNLRYFVVDRDVSHLHNKYVNAGDNSPEIDREISNLAYNDDGTRSCEMLDAFPVDEVRKGASVIACGFLP